ncbi:MAG: hypothetical protein H6998_20830 [Hahellaceae bacterium]|nr:hypothetical protein [Hahellaceae bacterium]
MAKYVFRQEIEKQNRGWFTVIPLGEDHHRKYFSDEKYGNKADSLFAALEHRNNVLKKHGIPITDRRLYIKLRVNNTTGLAGVSKLEKSYQGSFFVEENQEVKKKFGLKKYGEEGAFEMAKAWRQRMERAVYGVTVAELAKK